MNTTEQLKEISQLTYARRQTPLCQQISIDTINPSLHGSIFDLMY